ncbi:hypothetical protein DID77_01000 [Candidatus Marinamargulisbacteria bacterium SCGC AG-439-L15]|nr:hypothetical protein DID77_01000 [Candidatus Marinamargulisbacteria bacterium SCGC AG-439-L15]
MGFKEKSMTGLACLCIGIMAGVTPIIAEPRSDVMYYNQKNYELAGNEWEKRRFSFFNELYAVSVGDQDDRVSGYDGMNWFLGFTSKRYYKPLKLNGWNPFWHWGTAALFVPYVGIGSEYVWGTGTYFGVYSIYIFPMICFGFSF